MALWKALAANRMSGNGGFGPWETGVWYEIEGQVRQYYDGAGFHCSPDVLWCMYPCRTEYIAQVEGEGQSYFWDGVQRWQRMRVTKVKAWPPSKGALVCDWAEGRAHDYWADRFPSEAGLYDTRHYQGNYAAMLSIIQPLYKSLFVNGDTILRFPTIHHKRKPEYLWFMEQTVYLAYVLALALHGDMTLYGGGPFVRMAEDVRPGSWATVRYFVEDHWSSLTEL